ncbi:MAG: hypothetical protein HZA53_18910 [Planctomycetes bacterium]|nr:hypothetical protein [Planctomycetota bacterium]
MLERPEPFLALSADERRVFTLGPTPTLDVGDAATGRSIASFATDGYAFTYLVGPGVGDVVITTSNRGVRFWSAPRGR